MASPDAARRSDRSRRAILAATRELVAERGYAGLSIEGVAAAAGVVFEAILDANSAADGTVAVPESGEVEADLRSIVRATVAELADPATDRLQRAVTAEIQTDVAVADELVRRLLRPQLDAVADRVRAGMEVGQVDPATDAAIVVELLFGAIFHRWLLRTAPLDAAFADAVVTQVLAGLRPRGG